MARVIAEWRKKALFPNFGSKKIHGIHCVRKDGRAEEEAGDRSKEQPHTPLKHTKGTVHYSVNRRQIRVPEGRGPEAAQIS